MPLVIPGSLPAKEILSQENIFIMTDKRANTQDIRPLRVAILNLMPTKIQTETQLLRMISNTPLQVHVDLVRTGSYDSKNTSKEHLEKFYVTFSEIKNQKYDAMIITGAPVEKMPYEDVNYWKELVQIMEYARAHVYSTMFLCWASQAALYYYYGIPKYHLEEKLFGVFENRLIDSSVLTRGFDQTFYAPQSRYTTCREEDLRQIPDLKILALSPEAGVHMASTRDNRLIFVAGHGEYDAHTLDDEYRRDLAKGKTIAVPQNYYVDDDPQKDILVRWRTASNLFFSNWINYCVYQETPYDITQIDKKVVSKFGGSSLANADQFHKVKDIVRSDKERSYIVVSAPGKRTKEDIKITDVLEQCSSLQKEKIQLEIQRQNLLRMEEEAALNLDQKIRQVEDRFEDICRDLGIRGEARCAIGQIAAEIRSSTDKDFILSRGEYLNAMIMAEYLGYNFVDAKDLIFFDEKGQLDEEKTYASIQEKINSGQKVVVPGFYGSDAQGKIKTFQRGGSDITGSIIARGIQADLYENWTDVNGIMTDDPNKNADAQTIENLSYNQLLEITNNGAQVYHPDAIRPVAEAHIPIRIKNTNQPQDQGTIVKEEKTDKK